MLRHAIPPARFFSQIPNDILRHPRLGSDAVRLLSWQLSLPADRHESLSATAARAGVKPVAFQRAKKQLKQEGFFHEWKEQGRGGLWRTQQLVSNVPLTADEVASLRDSAPAPANPVVGERAARSVGRHPDEERGEKTSNLPAPAAEPAPEPDPVTAEARQLVGALRALDPRLRVPRGMVPELAALAAQWLRLGHTPGDVRETVRQALPGPSQPIHRPGGLLRHLLRDAPPAPAPPEPPRVSRMRECAGDRHPQPLLFEPMGDEELCRDCRLEQAEACAPRTPGGVLATVRGVAAARSALRGGAFTEGPTLVSNRSGA
ncbi:hypothetical protein ACH4D4_16230 [Streptomyces pristinaespiralis]|uniref:hypothetical protein n=1 Tax=Streptomyces pristinaespiralis TaxID=38300 RepID=UPI0037BB5D31